MGASDSFALATAAGSDRAASAIIAYDFRLMVDPVYPMYTRHGVSYSWDQASMSGTADGEEGKRLTLSKRASGTLMLELS